MKRHDFCIEKSSAGLRTLNNDWRVYWQWVFTMSRKQGASYEIDFEWVFVICVTTGSVFYRFVMCRYPATQCLMEELGGFNVRFNFIGIGRNYAWIDNVLIIGTVPSISLDNLDTLPPSSTKDPQTYFSWRDKFILYTYVYSSIDITICNILDIFVYFLIVDTQGSVKLVWLFRLPRRIYLIIYYSVPLHIRGERYARFISNISP